MDEGLHERETDSLLRLTRTISDGVPFEEVLHVMIEEARKRFAFQALAVVLLDEETETLGIKIARGISNSFIKGYRRPIGSGVTARLIWSEEPVLMAEADAGSAEYRELKLENDFASLVCVPIVLCGGAIGYMHLERAAGEPYTRDDLRFAQLIANLSATAKEMGSLRTQTEQLTFIDQITQALKSNAFLRALGRELERARLLSVRTAVGLLDLDNFKRYSEIHGLKAGRKVLADVAGIIRAHLKGIDLVGRFGLDELMFAVFKVGDREEAYRLFDAIREGVEEYGRSCPEPHPLATIGGLVIEPAGEIADFTPTILKLRHALHAGRDRGGNVTHFVEG
jgi:diguanylate cyclase (GGDEF)-like protein